MQAVLKEPEKIKLVTPPANWSFHDEDRRYLASREELRRRGMHDEFLAHGPHAVIFDLERMNVLKKGEDDNAVIDPVFVETVENLLAELGK